MQKKFKNSIFLLLVFSERNYDKPSKRIPLLSSLITSLARQNINQHMERNLDNFNTLRTGDSDLRYYITTVQDGCRKSAFLTRSCFPCTIHL